MIEPLRPDWLRGVARVDDRRVVNGIFYVLRKGSPGRNFRAAVLLASTRLWLKAYESTTYSGRVSALRWARRNNLLGNDIWLSSARSDAEGQAVIGHRAAGPVQHRCKAGAWRPVGVGREVNRNEGCNAARNELQ